METPPEKWTEFVSGVQRKNPKLAGILRNCIPNELPVRTLILGDRQDDMFLELLTPEAIDELKESSSSFSLCQQR